MKRYQNRKINYILLNFFIVIIDTFYKLKLFFTISITFCTKTWEIERSIMRTHSELYTRQDKDFYKSLHGFGLAVYTNYERSKFL